MLHLLQGKSEGEFAMASDWCKNSPHYKKAIQERELVLCAVFRDQRSVSTHCPLAEARHDLNHEFHFNVRWSTTWCLLGEYS